MNNSGTTLSVPLLARKSVTVDFAGGDLSSDAGGIPLALADQKMRLTERLAGAVADPRDPRRIDHSLQDLFRERIYLIALGYEDANDAQTLRHDPLLKLAVGRSPGEAALASQSTLSRFENSVTQKDLEGVAQVLLEQFLERCGPAPKRIVLDLDPFADECHGNQQGVLFHGYYDCYCYLPLYVCGSVDGGPAYVIGALLREGGAPPPRGARFLLKYITRAIRQRYPDVEIIVRGDGGFGVPPRINTCRHLDLRFCFGKPQNARLHALSEREQLRAAVEYSVRKRSYRVYGEFAYQAQSWRQAERTIVKVEVTQGKLNPRFVFTDLPVPEEGTPPEEAEWSTEGVYQFYCGRGMNPEHRIKEFVVDLAGDRLSCQRFRANQFRLLLHVAAYQLIQMLQTGLAASEFATAQAGTIRVKLLKVAARVLVRCRGVRVQLPTSYPWQRIWCRLVTWLQGLPERPPGAARASA